MSVYLLYIFYTAKVFFNVNERDPSIFIFAFSITSILCGGLIKWSKVVVTINSGASVSPAVDLNFP